ncbi:MAG: hypothetical protein J3K34DRAFT_74580 [Monoraphidium minutum]|nr:MAG: hypothetical protein J3K34DRAFT_74580 [Monoraphidium minutum]
MWFHRGFCTPPLRANKQQPKSTPGGLSLATAPKTRACAPKAHTPRAGACAPQALALEVCLTVPGVAGVPGGARSGPPGTPDASPPYINFAARRFEPPVRSPWGDLRSAYSPKRLESWHIRKRRGRTSYIPPCGPRRNARRRARQPPQALPAAE